MPQTVRPLVAPMAVAAAEKQHGELDEATRERVKAMSAATDNVGLFFGEDIFLAIASILLIQGSLAQLRHRADAVPAVGLGDPDARSAPS